MSTLKTIVCNYKVNVINETDAETFGDKVTVMRSYVINETLSLATLVTSTGTSELYMSIESFIDSKEMYQAMEKGLHKAGIDYTDITAENGELIEF